jgi:ADP-heptose:LPS heptosyltransferase
MKILIIRLHGLDKLMATIPLVKAIALQHPEAIIHYVSTEEYQNYLSKFSEIEKLFFVKGDITPLVLQLLKEKYSHTIDLQRNARSKFITAHLGQQYNAILTKYSYPKGFFAQFNTSSAYRVSNLSSKFIQSTKDLHLSKENLQWYYPTLPEDELKKDDIPLSHSVGYYCIDVQEAQVFEKEISQLIQQIAFPVMLIGDQGSFSFAEKLKQIDPFKVYNACGKYTEAETFNLLKRSRLNLMQSVLHICLAAAAQKNLIVTSNSVLCIQELMPYAQGNSGVVLKYVSYAQNADLLTIVRSVLMG